MHNILYWLIISFYIVNLFKEYLKIIFTFLKKSHLQLFRIVSQTGEEDNAQDKEEYQQSELLGRGLERMDEDP